MQITVTVNGAELTREVEPRLLLIHFLRDDLRADRDALGLRHLQLRRLRGLAGRDAGEVVHGARRHGGRAPGAHGGGPGARRRLDPVQQGFAECHGLQCGFCTPGMMLTARWLLDHNPDPSPEQIREALSGQICRCTGYENIVRSVSWASRARAAAPRRPAGGRVTRRAPASRIGAYGSVAARRTRASSAARARSWTTSRCPACCTARSCAARWPTPGSSRSTPRRREAHPRVEAVITGETLATRSLAWMPTLSQDMQAVLATDKVRFQGQEVAFVVAQDRYSARDALELINVEYEPLPPVIDAERALDPGAPVIRDDLRRQGRTTTSSTGRPATRRRPTRPSPPRTWWSPRTCSTRASHPAPLETCGSGRRPGRGQRAS